MIKPKVGDLIKTRGEAYPGYLMYHVIVGIVNTAKPGVVFYNTQASTENLVAFESTLQYGLIEYIVPKGSIEYALNYPDLKVKGERIK